MNDASTPPPAPPPAAGLWATKITGAAAVLGTLFALGQSGSALIQGYIQSHTQIELEKLKTNSEVFDKYFQLAFGKETTQDNNVILLGALAQIDGHPLQKWAQDRYEKKMMSIKDVDEAQTEFSRAQNEKDEAQRHLAEVSAQISETKGYLEGLSETPDARKMYIDRQKSLTIELALAKGKAEQSTANANVASQYLKVTQSEIITNFKDKKMSEANEYIYVDKLSLDIVASVFTGAKDENISRSLPFIKAALKEFQLSSSELVSYTIAIMRRENADFVPVSEGMNRFNTRSEPFDLYESRMDLGNKQQGDGAKFKGRGFLQITGRSNYAHMDELLGLGSRLIESPEDINDPDIAARALCAFVSTHRTQISTALQAGDLASAIRFNSGSEHGLAEFIQAYQTLLSSLKAAERSGREAQDAGVVSTPRLK